MLTDCVQFIKMTIRLFGHAFARHAIVLNSVNSARCCCYPTGFNGTPVKNAKNNAVNWMSVSRRSYSEKRQVVQSKSKGSSEVTVGQKGEYLYICKVVCRLYVNGRCVCMISLSHNIGHCDLGHNSVAENGGERFTNLKLGDISPFFCQMSS